MDNNNDDRSLNKGAKSEPLYEGRTDEELVAMYKFGDYKARDFLLVKYMGLVKYIAGSYYASGYDNDDMSQIGMMALLSAMDSYKEGHGSLFKSFASLCINNKLKNFVSVSNSGKNQPLKDYISLDQSVGTGESGEESNTVLGDMIPADASYNPEESYLYKDMSRELADFLVANLSKLELQVWNLRMQGYKPSAIAVRLDKPSRSIENALARMRRKLRGFTDK